MWEQMSSGTSKPSSRPEDFPKSRAGITPQVHANRPGRPSEGIPNDERIFRCARSPRSFLECLGIQRNVCQSMSKVSLFFIYTVRLCGKSLCDSPGPISKLGG